MLAIQLGLAGAWSAFLRTFCSLPSSIELGLGQELVSLSRGGLKSESLEVCVGLVKVILFEGDFSPCLEIVFGEIFLHVWIFCLGDIFLHV